MKESFAESLTKYLLLGLNDTEVKKGRGVFCDNKAEELDY